MSETKLKRLESRIIKAIYYWHSQSRNKIKSNGERERVAVYPISIFQSSPLFYLYTQYVCIAVPRTLLMARSFRDIFRTRQTPFAASKGEISRRPSDCSLSILRACSSINPKLGSDFIDIMAIFFYPL